MYIYAHLLEHPASSVEILTIYLNRFHKPLLTDKIHACISRKQLILMHLYAKFTKLYRNKGSKDTFVSQHTKLFIFICIKYIFTHIYYDKNA